MHHTLDASLKMWLAPGIIDARERQVDVVGVSTYAGCVPTFVALTQEGALYVDIPPSHLCTESGRPPVDLADVVYRNCPTRDTWGGCIGALQRVESCTLYGHDRTLVCTASYLYTLDWYQDNWMAHIFLGRGRLMIWPHYRVTWGGNFQPLPQGFQKVRTIWRLP